MAMIFFVRIQEEQLNHEVRRTRVTPRLAMSRPTAPSTTIEAPAPKKLTRDELRERLSKESCWHCDKPWSREHHCKKGQLLMIEPVDQKMVAKRSELEGNSDDGGRIGQQQCWLQLRCNFVAAGGIGCNNGATTIEEDGATMYMTNAEKDNSGMERETAAIMFNLLLVAIKIVGSERLLWAAM
ncbi:hypothetical protein B296_00040660 [Ensete ventricosum]|uniref:Uncharacterized protein n=1 Tax=Ensete ventricosum TaxID=4639 RepID=A0A426Y591_ENSVE|nr:hypothetical protein B296_00040660 [Ensete ventricosum]